MQWLAINAVPALLAITVHEVAHGWVAGKRGDPTARMMGRITLNPLAHIDPVGTVLMPLLQYFSPMGRVFFGWARPVPVNFANLRNPRADTLLVALAGPASNLMQFLFWVLVLLGIDAAVGLSVAPSLFTRVSGIDLAQASAAQRVAVPLSLMALSGLSWNASLFIVNLVPILPLDGGRILGSLLPPGIAEWYANLERFGFLFVIGFLIFFGPYLAYAYVPLELLLRVVFGG